MKRLTLLGAVLLATATTVLAGQQLTIKDITNGTFRTESMVGVEPLSDGESYTQISSDGKQIVKYSFKTGKQSGVLFDVNTARGSKIERVDGYVMSPDGRHMLIQTKTKSIYRHSFTAVYYIFNVANNRLVPLSDGGPQQIPVWSPDGNQVAFVRDNNIFLVKLLYNNAESQVTKDGKFNEVINGLPDWVNEEEFSFNSAMVFSADSKQIVWVRYDESEVKQYSMSLFKGLKPEREEYASYPGFYTYKYPKAGEQNSKVKVMSYDIKSHQTRTMQLPLDADGYIPRIKATSDPTKVAVFTLNRHQDELKVFMANPMSTICQQVIEDKVDKYINENVFANLVFTDKHIVLTSERSGFNSIYVYTLNGQLLRTVQQGVVTDVYGYDDMTGDVYFAALNNGPTNKKVFVNHKNGKTDCLTPKNGWNSAIFSHDLKNFVLTWSDVNNPSVYSLCNNQGKTLTTLIDNKKAAEKYASYDMGTKEFFTFQTSEGVQLYGYMVKPKNFDANKKYPVVMFQYGGPGSQQVKNAWGIGMSGNGAIMEELEARDQVETALWLGQQSYVDKDRIGIWGWSYGGWNTLMSMSEGRPVFCCGVAIAPPTCWRYYDTVYTERFMRTPKENASGYDEVNPIARVGKLHGALLLCHGLADDNVHYQNTAEYVEALVQADKDFRQLVYTNRNHSIFGGNTRNHLFRQCVNFFNENLK